MNRQAWLDQIHQNIERHGHHITSVAGGPSPRFAYTVGLTPDCGSELLLAGALIYDLKEVCRLLNEIARRLRAGEPTDTIFIIDTLGAFRLRRAHSTWIERLLLGAIDVYRDREISAYQVVPDADHMSIDVPDTTLPRRSTTAPAWRWLDEEWGLPVPASSHVGTTLEGLRGGRITELARWEDDYWEMFVDGPPDDTSDMHIVPIGAMLGHDPSLREAVDLPVEGGLWRDATGGPWNDWKRRGS